MSLLSDLVPLGTSGSSGTSGYSGSVGTSGTSGTSGASGAAGTGGTTGTSGASGGSGYSGTAGTSGYSAYSGKSGTSGYSGSAGSSPTTIDVTVTAGEALSARDCVYIAPVTGGGLTAGRAYKADADTARQSTQGFWCGFATDAISAAATGTVRVAGILTGFTLTAGAPQYISATAGAITATAPTNWRIVGIALDTTNLLINNRGANTAVTAYGVRGWLTHASACNKVTYATDVFSTVGSGMYSTQQSGIISEGISKAYQSMGASSVKFTFSSETQAACTTANLSSTRVQCYQLPANNAIGYWPSGGSSAVTDKITYSSDSTAAQTSANVSVARNGSMNVNNFDTKGYMVAGTGAGVGVITDKLTYSNDTTAACTTANASLARWFGVGMGNGTTKGYVGGGDSSAGYAPTVTMDKITFSTDTTAAATSINLLKTRFYFGGVSEGTKGYFCGGYTANNWTTTTQADIVTFSTDTIAAGASAMTAACEWGTGFSDVAF